MPERPTLLLHTLANGQKWDQYHHEARLLGLVRLEGNVQPKGVHWRRVHEQIDLLLLLW